MDKIQFSSHCFVFAQAWPSWSYTLSSMGCTKLTTSVEWSGAVPRKEFEATELGGTLQEMVGARKALLQTERPLVFIQGTKSFVDRIIRDVGSHPCGLICAVVPKLSKKIGSLSMHGFGGLSWRALSHKQVCGATTGDWLVGSNCTIKKNLFWTSDVKRNLGHSLSDVESGTVVSKGKPATTFKKLPVYRSNDRVPPGLKRFSVEFGSVFERNLPVLRTITDREMMEVYDVEIPTQTALRKFWKKESVTASRAFCCAAPAKLLRTAARTVLLATGSVTILDLNVDNRSAAEKLKTAPSVTVDPKAAPKFGYEADSPSTKTETKLPSEPSMPSQPSVKATKNDDAQVDPTQWNLWCVDQFDPDDLASTPLVCVAGSFSEEKHGRLFKAMRSWMHKLYRR